MMNLTRATSSATVMLMDIARIPHSQTHLMVFGDNSFSYIPQVWAARYTLHIDSSGHPEATSGGKRAKRRYATGWSLFGSNTHQKVEMCLGAGSIGRWVDDFEGSDRFEEKGIRTIIAMLAPLLKGVSEGRTELFVRCDNQTAINRVANQHGRSRRGHAAGLTGVSDKAKLIFAWERGHRAGVHGNGVADKQASSLYQAMGKYGTLSPMMARDVVHSALPEAKDLDMQRFFNKFSRAGEVLAQKERAITVALSSTRRKERWSWTCDQGFGAEFIDHELNVAQSMERIANVAREMSLGDNRIYLTTPQWQGLDLNNKAYVRMFRDLDVVILPHTAHWPSINSIGNVAGMVDVEPSAPVALAA